MTPLRIISVRMKLKQKIGEIDAMVEESCAFHPESYFSGYRQALKDILEEL